MTHKNAIMKTTKPLIAAKGYFMIFFMGYCQLIFSQTFTNNTVTAAGWSGGTLTKTIAVSGLPVLTDGTFELNQFNLHMGRQTDGTYNYSYYTVRITSPLGTTATMINGQGSAGSWSFPNGNVNEFNAKFRDNQYLQFPANGSGSLSEPWHIGYYRTLNANAFSVFNGENPNGNWTLTIMETSVSTGARFNSASLIFSPSLIITDYTTFTGNNDCSYPFCLRGSEIVIGTNNLFSSQSDDMYNPNTTGCVWNAAQNNSAWYKFVAASTNVKITISGITGSLQILGIYSSGNQCTSSNNTVVTGGCPEDVTNDTYISPRYSNGSTNNNQLIMSGLTIGNTYYFIVDGTGGAISPFYVEITGADDGACNDILPVVMTNLKTDCDDYGVNISWKTMSEINNDFFTILKSSNGVDFRETGYLKGAGNSSSPISYHFTDFEHLSGTSYYQIMQTDYDGTVSTSKTFSVNCKEEPSMDIVYQPRENKIQLHFTQSKGKQYFVSISDPLGRLVFHRPLTIENDDEKIFIDDDVLGSGLYHISVLHQNELFSKQILICRE